MLFRLISINPVSDGRLGLVDTKKAGWRFHHTLVLRIWVIDSNNTPRYHHLFGTKGDVISKVYQAMSLVAISSLLGFEEMAA
jgi:hypothetical protein